MLLLLITCAFTVASVSPCDPLTQYDNDGTCCKMCGPGTRMSLEGRCLDPRCEPCKDGEYQDTYTKETKCKRQPYCDPNLNFVVPRQDTEHLSTCRCKQGHHCSSEACLTCVAHTRCGPGEGVKSKGMDTHDTVCEECLEGTYSNETSENEACMKWTVCEDGAVKVKGTPTSDAECEKSSGQERDNLITGIIIGVVVLLAALIAGIVFYILYRGNVRGAKEKMNCVENGAKMPEKETNPIEPQHPTDEPRLHLTSEQEAEEDDEFTGNEEVRPFISVDPISVNPGITANGHVVEQEEGKTEVLSLQESQQTVSSVWTSQN